PRRARSGRRARRAAPRPGTGRAWRRGLRASDLRAWRSELPTQHLEGLLATLVGLGLGVVLRPHLRGDPGAVDRGPVTGQILPHREIERAAVIQGDHLLDG